MRGYEAAANARARVSLHALSRPSEDNKGCTVACLHWFIESTILAPPAFRHVGNIPTALLVSKNLVTIESSGTDGKSTIILILLVSIIVFHVLQHRNRPKNLLLTQFTSGVLWQVNSMQAR